MRLSVRDCLLDMASVSAVVLKTNRCMLGCCVGLFRRSLLFILTFRYILLGFIVFANEAVLFHLEADI